MTPVFVTFEQAVLLKEKGFNIPCFYYYENGKLTEPYLENGSSTDVEFKVELTDLLEYYSKYSQRVSAPEQHQVVEWLRVNHSIWIVINFANKTQWYFNLNRFGFDGKNKSIYKSDYNYNTPQSAYSAAISYTLNNLI